MTMAMLLCLKPKLRMAYILGNILECDHNEAAHALNINKDNFRQQLVRGRKSVIEFAAVSCGLVNQNAHGHCPNKLHGAIQRSRIASGSIVFASDKQYSYDEVKNNLLETQESLRTLDLHKSIIAYKSPEDLSTIIGNIVTEGLNANESITELT